MVEKTGSWSNYKELHFFINNIGWSIRDYYGHWNHDLIAKIIPILDEKNINSFLSKYKKSFNKEKAINNLWHAWYAECSLDFPSIESIKSYDEFEDFKKDPKDDKSPEALQCLKNFAGRIKKEYSAWKFIKTYYCMFFYISAMLRVITQTSGGHTTKLNLFKHGFYNSNFEDFFPYPFNIYLRNGKPSIEKPEEGKQFKYIVIGLEKIKDISSGYYSRLDRNKFTIPDALFLWRNRINYTSIYSFIKCYGSTYKDFFFGDLQRITFMFALIAEIFLIKCFGLELLKEEFESFKNELDNSGLRPSPIIDRFRLYDSNFLKNKKGYFED